MAIAILLTLLFFLLVRPMEFLPALQAMRPLPVLTFTAVAFALNERLSSRSSSRGSPQWPWVFAFLGWAILSTVKSTGFGGIARVWGTVGLPVVYMFVVAYCAASLERMRKVIALLVGIVGFISVVCIHQSTRENRCIRLIPDESGEIILQNGEIENRTCVTARECEITSQRTDGAEYDCEKPGWFGSFSVKGRVRWLGQMEDPNEYAIFVAMILPLGLAYSTFAGMERAARRQKQLKPGYQPMGGYYWLIPFLVLALAGVVLSQSRAGQLVVSIVFFMYFVRRYGAKGFIIAAVCAMPVVLLGGRSNAAADASSVERAQILYHGFDLVKSRILMGVGMGNFVDEMPIAHTAHNSYLLAAAELGFLGAYLWVGLLYVSAKIPYQIFRQPPWGLRPEMRELGFALLCGFAGLSVGVFTLSYCYKQLFFAYLGLSAALYASVKGRHPEFSVKMRMEDHAAVFGVTSAFLVVIWLVGRAKGG